jgi:uncharacterized protein (TIGR03437 family)
MKIFAVLFVCLPAFSQGSIYAVVSAAGGSSLLAKESIASAYGTRLASRTESATSDPLPIILGGITLEMVDSQGATRLAPLFYVSPNQINFQIPPGTSSGVAKILIFNGTDATISGTAQIQNVAPGLFTADGNGQGPVAGYGLRGNPQLAFPIFKCDANGCRTLPINVALDPPVYVVLFGTGFRSRSSLGNVVVTMNGIQAQVSYAGPQPEFSGLDQFNISFPFSLAGTGEMDLLVSVDGIQANAVRINIQ